MNNNSQPSVFINNPNDDNQNENIVNQGKKISAQTLNLGKVFLYMVIGIILTAATSMLVSGLINYFMPISDAAAMILFALSIVCSIATLICSFVAGALTLKSKPKSFSVAIPFGIYSLSIGYLLGLIGLALPWQIFATTFGVTIVIFAILSLVGLLVKSNLNPLLYVSLTLLAGAGLLALINYILFIFMPELVTPLYWIVSFVIFGALMLSTIWDVWSIKKISQGYELTRNMSLYCAFRLYCDFVALFVRLLYIIILIFASRRN